MSDDRSELRNAAETLTEVRESLQDDDTADRIATFAERLRSMADADRGPDHGQLDRTMHGLREVAEKLDGELADEIESARERVRSYRETVEGV
jgi:hypothetical protein